MSFSTTKLGDEFLRVPKLDVAGINWVVYKDRFLWSIDARGLLDHLEGTEKEPADPITAEIRSGEKPLDEAQLLVDAEWKKAVKEWRQGEAVVKQQIAGTIPDSLFMKIRGKGTAREIWDGLGDDFQKKSRMVSVDLRRRLQQEKCVEKGDVRAHFSKLRTMREDLASMGHPPSDDDMYAIALGSLPPSYDSYISAVSATSSVLGTTISADALMTTITDEYDRRLLNSKGGKKDENVAFHSHEGSSKGRKGGAKKDVECFNCHKKGHYKADCWAEGGGKEGEGPKMKGKGKAKPKEAAAAVVAAKEKVEEKVEAWMVSLAVVDESEETQESFDEADLSCEFNSSDDLFDNMDSLPDLQSISDDSEIDEIDAPEYPSNLDKSFDEAYITPDIHSNPSTNPNTCSDMFDSLDSLSDELEYTPTNEEAYVTTYEASVLRGTPGVLPTDVDLYDSGASRHMSGFRHRFSNFVKIAPKPITAADRRSFSAVGKGDVWVYLPNGKEKASRVLLKGVLYAPAMGVTLVSISCIAAAGSTVVFTGNTCQIFNNERKVIGIIQMKSGLYRVFSTRPLEGEYAGKARVVVSIDELHRRLGHVSHERARMLVSKSHVEGVELDMASKPSVCESCEWAKGERKAITRVHEGQRTTEIGGEIHSDLWGPAPVETINRKFYYISFTDDFSRFTSVYFLRTKDEAFESYKAYEAWMKTQHNHPIKALRSDRGGEYLDAEFSAHLKKAGTIRKLTTHDTPEYNGVSERLNRTIITKVRAMLHDSQLPKFLWGEATKHAVYLKNRTWTRALGDTTPFEILTKKKPNLADLHPWGCRVRVHDTSGSKLDGRSKIGRWMGFDEETGDGHRIYWAEKRSITIERSVKFNFEEEIVVGQLPLEGENTTSEPKTSQNLPIPKSTIEEVVEPVDVEVPDHLGEAFESEPPAEGRGKRIRKESDYARRLRDGEGVTTGLPSATLLPKGLPRVQEERETGNLADDEEIELDVADVEREFAMATAIEGAEGLNPSFEEVRKRADWPRWEEAIRVELKNLKDNGTWMMVERPAGANIVNSRWVLRVKKNAAGEVEKYKARLVAKGFTQIYGVDYYEMYAPVARLASIRLLLAIPARNDWPVDAFDFDSAYLNSVLSDEDETIYLEQPPNYPTMDRNRYVWKLLKTLYGLKQGAKNWYDALCKALVDLGFQRAEADHGIFFKRTGVDIIILAVHVDDCALTGSSRKLIDEFKVQMNKTYKISDLGAIHWLLGIKVTRDLPNHTISLSQHAYIDSIILRYNFTDLKPSAIPMDPCAPLLKSQSPTKLADIARMKNIPYREAVGSLMYAAMGTRPDIAFAVSTVAQFSDNPGWAHWEAVKRIFKYLRGTQKLELVYGGEKRGLEGYVDADGASQEHRRAISGFVFLVDGGAVSWSSKKQELVTLSTTEAEYVAATHAAKEAVWIRRLIGEVFRPLTIPTTLYSDSKSAIALAKDGHYHARTKHIDIRYHFIRYIIEAETIKLIYCPTDEMTADTLTKALPNVKAKNFATALGLCTV